MDNPRTDAPGGRPKWPLLAAGLTLVASLGATYVAWKASTEVVEAERKASLENRIREVQDRFGARMGRYERALRGIQGLFASVPAVDRRAFARYVEAIRPDVDFQGIQAIGFQELVPGTELESHVQRIRAEGIPGYTIRPGGPRELLAPIVFIEPFEGANLGAIGFDPLSDPTRRRGLEHARDEDEAVLSAKVALVQEMGSAPRPGVVLYVPVYGPGSPRDTIEQRRASTVGWAYVAFRVGDVMEKLLAEHDWGLDVGVYDGATPTFENTLYDSRAATSAGSLSGGIPPLLRTLEIAGRDWTLAFSPQVGPGEPVGLTRPRIVGVAGIVVSILAAALVLLLARRAVDRRIRDVAAYTRSLIEASLDPLVTISRQGKITDVNAATERVTGLPRDRLIGTDFADYFTEPDRARAGYLQVLDHGAIQDFPLVIRDATGSTTEVLYNASVYRGAGGEVEGVFASARDVTRVKAAERALRDALQKLERHVASSPLAIVEWDPDYRIREWNPRAEEMFGWTAAEAVGKRIEELPWIPEEDRTSVQAVSGDMTAGSRPSNVNVNRNRRKDGRIIYCEWHNSAIYDDEGRLVSVLSMVEDVTARVEAIAELRASETKLALFVEHAPAAIAMFDREMRYLATSRRWLVDYGLGRRDVIGRSHYEIFPDLPERWRSVHQRCLGGAVERKERDPFPRSDGTIDWVDWEVHPWRKANGEIGGLVIASEIVTERVELEAKLAMSSRLAALGTLVGGLAHEINNPLAGQLSSESFAAGGVADVRDRLRSGEPLDRDRMARTLDDVGEALADAQGAGRRIAAILKDLNVFGHAEQRRARTRLVDVVERAVRHLPAAVSKGADVHVVDEHAPDVVVSPGQMVQVIGNLVANAVKATRGADRGTVTITVGPGDVGLARIDVTDRGVGIEPEIMERIFDPFFTTRAVGQGMGLGLPVCHAIVTDHGGTLTVRSEVGKGSTFRVELPAAPDEA